MAHVTYSMASVEEMGIRLNISGFSDKLFEFAKNYIDILLGCAEDGFLRENMMHSIAKKKSEYESNS